MIALTQGTISQFHDGVNRAIHPLPVDIQSLGVMLNEAIQGRLHPAMIDFVRKTHRGAERRRLDDVPHALLRHMDLEPDVLAAMAQVTVVNVMRGADIAATFGTGMTRIHDSGMTWESPCVLTLKPGLPHIVEGAFERMPLGRILSHPVLDRMDLVAEHLETSRGETRIVVSGVRPMTGPPLPQIGKRP